MSAHLNSDVVNDVNVESLARLSGKQVRWLKRIAKNGHFTERAITTAQDYLDGFMEDGEEELGPDDESLSGKDSDGLTDNDDCGA